MRCTIPAVLAESKSASEVSVVDVSRARLSEAWDVYEEWEESVD